MLKSLKIIFIGIIFLAIPLFAGADELLEEREFFVDSNYDLNNREKITAVLQRITDQLYFYLDADWWNSLNIEWQKEVQGALAELSHEFKNNIYPVLTLNYGSEWKPGIDNEKRITILIHPMTETAAGYFNTADEYPQAQVLSSNQREMVYLNSSYIAGPLNKSFLAHEFTHLITFNQKERNYNVSEETWLNEARAEYAPSLLGYDKEYQNTNLQKRVDKFLDNPQDSLTEWKGESSDYGVLNLFTQYLVDHYGLEILTDSLRSEKVGIPSINYALAKNGFSNNLSRIFIDWTIAIFVNDCDLGLKYCYLNDNLKNLRITPFIYYLPGNGESTLSIGYLTKEWSGNWQKIIGGKESLKLEFSGSSKKKFKVPYVVEDSEGVYSVNFLELDEFQKGTIYLENEEIVSLTIIPSIQDKIIGFSDKEISYQFFWSATTENTEKEKKEKESALIKELQETIRDLEAEIVRLQSKINAILAGKSLNHVSGQWQEACQKFENNLYYGIKNNEEVSCLQEFLKSRGPEIYPEALVTGNFLSLTRAAVIRFQEKYSDEILNPLNLKKGTGYFGPLTREFVNSQTR